LNEVRILTEPRWGSRKPAKKLRHVLLFLFKERSAVTDTDVGGNHGPFTFKTQDRQQEEVNPTLPEM